MRPGPLALIVFAACGEPREVRDATERLGNADPVERYAATCTLAPLVPRSEGARDALIETALDASAANRVRLLAAVALLAAPDATTELLRARATDDLPAGLDAARPGAALSPDPSPAIFADLGPGALLVYQEPWFAGTLAPFAIVLAKSGDPVLADITTRALRQMEREGEALRSADWNFFGPDQEKPGR